ncbi:MAG: glutathione S-transferase [Rhodobacteraceae bacterium]|nr:glutathione S-transferase [Paracoccaceae bacterium]
MDAQGYKVIGHRLCPYVQRVVITLDEHGLAFTREDIDLDRKPAWLEDLSPNREVPVLRLAEGDWLVESGVIARYLDRVSGGGLLPRDARDAARHEAWIAHADGMLSLVAGVIYLDQDARAVERSVQALAGRLDRMVTRLPPDPYFSGSEFGLVDIVMATLVRYFEVIDLVSDTALAPPPDTPLGVWWARVRGRRSVARAVPAEYEAELRRFIAAKPSHAGRVLAGMELAGI